MMALGAAASIAFWIDPPAGTSAAETPAPPASGAAVGNLVSPQAMAATRTKAEQKRARSMVTSLMFFTPRSACGPSSRRQARLGEAANPEGLPGRPRPARPISGLDRVAVGFGGLELAADDVAHDSGAGLGLRGKGPLLRYHNPA